MSLRCATPQVPSFGGIRLVQDIVSSCDAGRQEAASGTSAAPNASSASDCQAAQPAISARLAVLSALRASLHAAFEAAASAPPCGDDGHSEADRPSASLSCSAASQRSRPCHAACPAAKPCSYPSSKERLHKRSASKPGLSGACRSWRCPAWACNNEEDGAASSHHLCQASRWGRMARRTRFRASNCNANARRCSSLCRAAVVITPPDERHKHRQPGSSPFLGPYQPSLPMLPYL
mmetsp:Transcript_41144/g.92733  ORF Transcript_41144/g.92733 Transcript_41144/m.92733 type:complete len:235 (+) Transcript_41144:366-1070(+)